MRKVLHKYAPALVIFGSLLFAVCYGTENGIYQGFAIRLGHNYMPFISDEPFPRGQWTILLYLLAFIGIVITVIGFIFGKPNKE